MTTTETVSMPVREGFVGRTPDGRRVFLRIELRAQHRGGQSVDHEPVEGYTELSISGSSARKHSRVMDSGGQNIDELRQVTQPAEDWTMVELRDLAEVWDRWHLNGMKAACAHQPAVAELDTPCPEGGLNLRTEQVYTWGSEWLIEPLPSEIITKVRRWAGKLDGNALS